MNRWILLLLLLPCTVFAQAVQSLTVGYLVQTDDPRYTTQRLEAQYRLQPWGRALAGAEVAVKDAQFPLSAVQLGVELKQASGKSAAELLTALEGLEQAGVRFFLVEAAGDVMAELAKQTRGKDLILFNISALDNKLRGAACQAHLLHVVPSWATLTDAVAQYLVAQKWRDVLVLKGISDKDVDVNEAFARSAKRFGLKVVETRDFVLGRNPRQRDQHNIALLTGDASYDVVFVADGSGEFARYVPYQTQLPRPVVGTEGLVADWWHWAWERQGAPQVNARFYKVARRHMNGYDWAAWMAVRVISEALLRKQTTDFKVLSAYIRSDEIVLDGVKGDKMGFRHWNNELRQSIFLTTANAVIERAPLDGFLHPVNNLDTLGYDEKENECRF